MQNLELKMKMNGTSVKQGDYWGKPASRGRVKGGSEGEVSIIKVFHMYTYMQIE
jgi:hypothetical protein